MSTSSISIVLKSVILGSSAGVKVLIIVLVFYETEAGALAKKDVAKKEEIVGQRNLRKVKNHK